MKIALLILLVPLVALMAFALAAFWPVARQIDHFCAERRKRDIARTTARWEQREKQRRQWAALRAG